MSNTNTGGPAFPLHNHGVQTLGLHVTGMTLRDYFAAKAMQIMWDAYDKGYCGLNNNDAPNVEIIAKGAYQMADAMLKAREA
jgi:hypothetical protein